jgi:hypothetical protein
VKGKEKRAENSFTDLGEGGWRVLPMVELRSTKINKPGASLQRVLFLPFDVRSSHRNPDNKNNTIKIDQTYILI